MASSIGLAAVSIAYLRAPSWARVWQFGAWARTLNPVAPFSEAALADHQTIAFCWGHHVQGGSGHSPRAVGPYHSLWLVIEQVSSPHNLDSLHSRSITCDWTRRIFVHHSEKVNIPEYSAFFCCSNGETCYRYFSRSSLVCVFPAHPIIFLQAKAFQFYRCSLQPYLQVDLKLVPSVMPFCLKYYVAGLCLRPTPVAFG